MEEELVIKWRKLFYREIFKRFQRPKLEKIQGKKVNQSRYMSDKDFVKKYLEDFSSLVKPNEVIIEKIINPSLAIGYTSVFIAIIFFSGVQLIFMGLLGEYIGKILKNVNKEPQYSIDYIKLNESEK